MSVKTYSTKQFTWTPSEYAFSAEASDLGVRPEDSAFGPLPSLPLASGLVLHNPDTGGEMEFQIIHVEFSQDNDILWWTLQQDGRNPKVNRAVRVIIYND